MKTFVLLAAFGGLFMLIGSFWGVTGLYIGLAIGLLVVGGSYWFSDKLAVASAGAKPVAEGDTPELYAIVRDLAQRPASRCPAIYLSPAAQPNAFATGRNPSHAVVCVTRGLMDLLETDEIRGVRDEMSHVKTATSSSVRSRPLAMAITFIARMAMFGAMFGGGGRDNEGGNVFGALLLASSHRWPRS